MPNVINYAEKWMDELIEFIQKDTITGEHVVSGVEWTSAQTFHFTMMSVSGFKDHNRNGGWNQGFINQVDVPYTVTHDRDIEFLVDVSDVDESNQTAKMENVQQTFMIQQQNPETDAKFFSEVASDAGAVITQDEVVGVDLTSANIVAKLKAAIKPLRRYGVTSVRGYLSPDVMELLELADNFKKELNVESISGMEGKTLETRVTSLDGVKLIEVEDTDRFYDSFDFTDGFVPVSLASRPLNFLFCTVTHSVTVPKFNNIYFFMKGEHTKGDGDLYQNHSRWDTFNLPNAKTQAVDSITGSSGVVLP
jgi:hypothetical protein